MSLEQFQRKCAAVLLPQLRKNKGIEVERFRDPRNSGGALMLDGLSLRFRQHDGSHLAPLAEQNLTLEPGQILGVVGGSGAGKSLIAAAIMGLLPRNAEVGGRVTVDGRVPRPGEIALAPQGLDALDPLATVGAQMARFAALAGVSAAQARERCARLLSQLGLSAGVVHLYPHMLSGGMAKRVLLATALIGGAQYLIVDEPTLGLDPEAADRIMAAIAALAGPERGILAISHDLQRLVRIAGRIRVLEEGRCVEEVPASAFSAGLEGLRHPFSRALWQAQTGPIAGAFTEPAAGTRAVSGTGNATGALAEALA